ncbi:hypothetical protein PHSY_005464 [Pseudozyma hubeiensis SY62]|uniref:Uncharacterized protein n=1 Tax=Pseudozyma hubeiensis (strain SY62) TaxID=1305764 RepID=R9P943_PSEHS|nr:hypothetical protein PHSY_005464 [Pseudozyma hubeiensis SY62]GAC97876.1 hypothetical protein PHSY_005464 [Pseudozyma hubeiensis SY62]
MRSQGTVVRGSTRLSIVRLAKASEIRPDPHLKTGTASYLVSIRDNARRSGKHTQHDHPADTDSSCTLSFLLSSILLHCAFVALVSDTQQIANSRTTVVRALAI